MAAFRYRLSALLTQREEYKADCEKALAGERLALRRAEDQFKELQQELSTLEQQARTLRKLLAR